MEKRFLSLVLCVLATHLLSIAQSVQKNNLDRLHQELHAANADCFEDVPPLAKELAQNSLKHAGFSKDFIATSGIVDYVSSQQKKNVLDILFNTCLLTNNYNTIHRTHVNKKDVLDALYIHNNQPTFTRCLEAILPALESQRRFLQADTLTDGNKYPKLKV